MAIIILLWSSTLFAGAEYAVYCGGDGVTACIKRLIALISDREVSEINLLSKIPKKGIITTSELKFLIGKELKGSIDLICQYEKVDDQLVGLGTCQLASRGMCYYYQEIRGELTLVDNLGRFFRVDQIVSSLLEQKTSDSDSERLLTIVEIYEGTGSKCKTGRQIP